MNVANVLGTIFLKLRKNYYVLEKFEDGFTNVPWKFYGRSGKVFKK